MQNDKDFFAKINRPKPFDADESYIIRQEFKNFFFNVSDYFMTNSSDGLYGINMVPSGKSAIISIRTAGIWTFVEETEKHIQDLFSECEYVSFIPKSGYMVIKFKYNNAFDIVPDE